MQSTISKGQGKNKIFRAEIDEEKCLGCGLCMDSCESHAIKGCLLLKNGVMCMIDEKTCLAAQPDCGFRCAQLCPNKAFKLKRA
ncbi:MAG TPA: 4Fe-4S binding protein [Candidatus Lokiarchaeia archaeon]|nr:4Fe-4S binding protein [Candidatus Lokiarchaeia archaeon]